MNILAQHLQQVTDTMYLLDEYQIRKCVDFLKEVRKDHGSVWIAGNGGSAATASHFANDLTKMCGMRAISIPDLVPITTAYGNDDGWDEMFSSVVLRMERAADAVIGITCSGNSANVVQMLEKSKARYRIVLTGPDENSRVTLLEPEILIRTKHADIRVVEDVHSVICHAISRMLEAGLKGL